MADQARQAPIHPETEAYVRHLIDQAAATRLPELFAEEGRKAIYRLPNRHGSILVVKHQANTGPGNGLQGKSTGGDS